MTNAELITKIKARIERLKATNPGEYNYQNAEGYVWALDDVLSFLSTLESEKPMNLEEEIKRFVAKYGYERGEDILLIAIVARHFAQWGADHTPLPEDTVIYNKGVEEGKRLMMEEAVEGLYQNTPFPTICLDDCKDYNFKDNQKVRIIIVKEN